MKKITFFLFLLPLSILGQTDTVKMYVDVTNKGLLTNIHKDSAFVYVFRAAGANPVQVVRQANSSADVEETNIVVTQHFVDKIKKAKFDSLVINYQNISPTYQTALANYQSAIATLEKERASVNKFKAENGAATYLVDSLQNQLNVGVKELRDSLRDLKKAIGGGKSKFYIDTLTILNVDLNFLAANAGIAVNNKTSTAVINLPLPSTVAGEKIIVKRYKNSTGIVEIRCTGGIINALVTNTSFIRLPAKGLHGQSIILQSDGFEWQSVNN